MTCGLSVCFKCATRIALAVGLANAMAPARAQQTGTSAAPAQAPAVAQPGTSQPLPDIYDTQADAGKLIAAALDKAGRENQRVLVMFGGNWCGWCRKLHGLFKSDREIAKLLQYEYQLVMVDIGRFDKQLDIAAKYGASKDDLKKSGVPFLTVLDPAGKVLASQETGVLETGDKSKPGHDPAKVKAFLDQWKPEPRDAEKVLADTLARAKSEQKTAFLHFGAPWCIWCHRLEDFMARPEIAAILNVDFVDLKIDVDRMKNAAAVVKRFRPDEKGGIPWIAFVSADGQVRATSDAAQGNIGFPAAPEEIDHFMGMVKKVAAHISAPQLDQLAQALKDNAAKLKAATPAQPAPRS